MRKRDGGAKRSDGPRGARGAARPEEEHQDPMSRNTDARKRYGIFCLVLLVISACGHRNKGTAMSHSDAEGLWQQSSEVAALGTEGKSLSDIYTFKYDHGLVTVRLLMISKMNWRSPDGFYTLKSRWQGDTLQYLAPLGQWTDLAEFENGRFVASGDGKLREYTRITPDQVADFNAAILKPDRPVFDYQRAR